MISKLLMLRHYFHSFAAGQAQSGVKTEEIRKGRILGGVQGYLEGIFGDPSLTQIQGKTWKNLNKYKKNLRKIKKKYIFHYCFIVFICFDPRQLIWIWRCCLQASYCRLFFLFLFCLRCSGILQKRKIRKFSTKKASPLFYRCFLVFHCIFL